MFFVKALFSALGATGAISTVFFILPGALEFIALWNSEQDVNIDMGWFISNANTPVFYFVVFVSVLFTIIVTVGAWRLAGIMFNWSQGIRKAKSTSDSDILKMNERITGVEADIRDMKESLADIRANITKQNRS